MNVIHITYFGETDEENLKTSQLLHKELSDNFLGIYPEYDQDNIYCAETIFELESNWIAPLQLFQHFCNKYNVDIIGVAHEFGNGYVESFELQNQLIQQEVEQHVLTFMESDNSSEEEISILPKSQDDEILDDECPATLDPENINLSDKEISNLQ